MKRLVAALATACILAVGMFAAPAAAHHQSDHWCVTIYENANLGGNNWMMCTNPPISILNLKNANLTGDTFGLTNGCNGANWPLTNPDWNDCISSFRLDNLPGGYRLQLYVHANYSFPNRCIDQNGDSSWNLSNVENDRTSSWRIEAGNC